MSDKKNFIDRPFAKWTLGIITIVAFIWGLIQTFRVREPELRYEIVSQVNLFNNTFDLSEVKLLVDTIDVLRGNKSISLFMLKVHNVGSNHLRSIDYDEGDFGIYVQNGEIIQGPSFEESCNEHIEERYMSFILSPSLMFMEIPRISLDRGDWYIVSFYIIHESGLVPIFTPIGKIIGQKTIDIVYTDKEKDNEPFWSRVFAGGFGINVVRFFLYFLILAVLLILVGYIGTSINDMIDKKREVKAMREIISNPEINSLIRDDYLKKETSRIGSAFKYLKQSDIELTDQYRSAYSFISDPRNVFKEDFDDNRDICSDIDMLINHNYIQKGASGDLSIPRGMKSSIETVQKILESNNVRSIWRYYDSIDYKRIEKGMDKRIEVEDD